MIDFNVLQDAINHTGEFVIYSLLADGIYDVVNVNDTFLIPSCDKFLMLFVEWNGVDKLIVRFKENEV